MWRRVILVPLQKLNSLLHKVAVEVGADEYKTMERLFVDPLLFASARFYPVDTFPVYSRVLSSESNCCATTVVSFVFYLNVKEQEEEDFKLG